MDFISRALISIALNPLDLNLWVCDAVLAVAVIFVFAMAIVNCQVVYVDPETNYEIHYEKHPWLSKVYIKDAAKPGKKFLGWSLNPEGTKPFKSDSLHLARNTELYAMWKDESKEAAADKTSSEEPAVEKNEIAKGNTYIELSFADNQSYVLCKKAYKVDVKVPDGYFKNDKLVGWALEDGKDAVVSKDAKDAVFTIPLFPVFNKDGEKKEVHGNKSLVVEFVYTENDADISRDSHEFYVDLPDAYKSEERFAGWGLEANGDVVLSDGDEGAILEIQLFPVYAKEEVAVEEPVAKEPVAEEPVVEEPVAEEPVAEEPVVEEPIAEEPVAEEPVVEEPVVEEPIAEEPVAEEPVAEEPVVEEPIIEEEPVVEEPVKEEVVNEPKVVIVPRYFANDGNEIKIKYSRSFAANIIQSDDTVKSWYSEIKNHIMSYDGVKSRISWKFDSYNKGRYQLFKMKLRGKTILLYCAYDPEKLDVSKYHHDAVDNKLFADVPTLLKIKSKLGVRKAKEVVDMVMHNFDIEKSLNPKVVDYVAKYPYEEIDALLAKELVKSLVSNEDVIKMSNKPLIKEPVEEEPVVEEDVAEEPVVEEPIVEEDVAEEPVVEEPIVEEDVAEEPVVEEPIVEEDVAEEPVVEEPIIEEEPVEEEPLPEEAVEEPLVDEEPIEQEHIIHTVESVDASEVDSMATDEEVDIFVEEDVDYITSGDTKREIVNIDVLSRNFNAGDVVDIRALKAKNLIDKKAKSIKVLARGRLDKPLTVKAGEFSKSALKMIILTGGSAIHVTYKVK